MFEHVENRIGTLEQFLVGLRMLLDDVDGVQIVGIEAVPRQHFACEIALQRCEAKAVVPVTLEDELDEVIA